MLLARLSRGKKNRIPPLDAVSDADNLCLEATEPAVVTHC